MFNYCDYCGLPEDECTCANDVDAFDDSLICPNCGAIWGTDEMIQERCYACGYSENEYDIGHYDETDGFDLVE